MAYVPPHRRAGAAQASSRAESNWRLRSRSAPEHRAASAGSLDAKSSSYTFPSAATSPPSPSGSQGSRRWSLPEPTRLEYEPILADVFTTAEASICSRLWEEHRRSQGSSNLVGVAKDVDEYKRYELEFRIWIFSRANLAGWRNDSYADIQQRGLTDISKCKQRVLDEATVVPQEVLAVLMKVIEGREALCIKFSPDQTVTEEDKAGHEHHVMELRRFHSELSAPPKPKRGNFMAMTSWRT